MIIIFINSFRITKKIILFFILSSIFSVSCEETLPTREEIPLNLFSTSFSTVDGRTAFPVTRDPAVITIPHPAPVRLQFLIINTFDETFQGVQDIINGSMDVWIADDINNGGNIYVLTKDNEFPPVGSPPLIENALLTIDPGDTFFVELSWPHEVNGTIKVWNYLEIATESSMIVRINVLAKIQLFQDQPPITSELLQLTITYTVGSRDIDEPQLTRTRDIITRHTFRL